MISFLTKRRALRAEARRHPSLAALLSAYRPLGRRVRFALAEGHLLARAEIERGTYAMYLPRPYTDGSLDRALCALEAYAVYQEIPLVYIDLSAEEGRSLAARYPLSTVDEVAEDTCVLAVATELDRLEDIPTVTDGSLTLRAPTLADADVYARLRADTEGMRYYGYNDTERGGADGRRLVERRLREFRRATALPLLLLSDGAPIGECVLYGFDGRRRASFSVRLLPEARGRGLGEAVFRAAMRYAKTALSLSTLCATVHEENLPSYRLLCRLFGDGVKDGELYHFSVELT